MNASGRATGTILIVTISSDVTDVIVAVDTGGTFTDVAGWDGDRIDIVKVRSTPSDPSEAIVRGLNKLMARHGCPERQFSRVVHGTTVATNAVLQRTGARVAFVANEGFGDLLLIGRNRTSAHPLATEWSSKPVWGRVNHVYRGAHWMWDGLGLDH